MSPLTDDQQLLAAQQLHMATTRAARFHRKHPSLNADDLLSAAQAALVSAAQRYDPELGTFEAYAGAAVHFDLCRVRREAGLRRSREWITPHGCEWHEPELTSAESSALFDRALEATPQTELPIILQELGRRAAGIVTSSLCRVQTDPESAVVARDLDAKTMQVVEMTLENATSEEQTFYRCYYREELTLDQTAAQLGTSKRTAQRIADRLQERLHDAFQAEGLLAA